MQVCGAASVHQRTCRYHHGRGGNGQDYLRWHKVIMTSLELNFTLSLFQFLNGGGMKINLEANIKISIKLHSLSYKLQWGVGPKKQTVNSLLKI